MLRDHFADCCRETQSDRQGHRRIHLERRTDIETWKDTNRYRPTHTGSYRLHDVPGQMETDKRIGIDRQTDIQRDEQDLYRRTDIDKPTEKQIYTDEQTDRYRQTNRYIGRRTIPILAAPPLYGLSGNQTRTSIWYCAFRQIILSKCRFCSITLASSESSVAESA